MLNKSLRFATIALAAVSACGKDNGPDGVGPPAQLVITSGNNQSAAANTTVAAPIVVQVQDADGDAVGAGQVVTFTVVAGGGFTTGSATVTTDASGNATAPQWRLGRSNLPQVMQASLSGITKDISATIQTSYDIVVRFYGSTLPTVAQQAFFTNAAARLEAIITGDITNAHATQDLAAACGESGLPSVNEDVDDIVIYAAITTGDGPGNVLASASPCLARAHPQPSGPQMVAYGFMRFDAADFPSLSNPQEVITHEMLHILGSGTLWETDRALISGKGGADPRFLGPLATAACAALGGPITCASSVPLENTGGAGTRDFHWRESVFINELMTGFYNTGVNPLSSMTIASMADLGFVVNNADFDAYTFAGPMVLPSVQANTLAPGWEHVGRVRGTLLPNGRVEAIKYK
jgi:hypothetical protein